MRILLLVTALALQPLVPLIDFVAEPSKPPKSLGFAGSFEGGILGVKRPPKLQQPLEMRLESISMVREQPRVRIVQVLVTNVSGKPYALPVGRDGEAALKPGNRGRRELWLQLRCLGIPGYPYATLSGQGERYASADTPGSFLNLPTGGTARVRFAVDLKTSPETYKWQEAGIKEIEVNSQLSDYYFGDERTDTYFISREVTATSNNTVALRLE